MSDSVWPHRRQPTRLPHPWDSPGKNTGVGCHFLLQCMKGRSESEVTQSCPTLSDLMDCSLPGFSVHGIFQARVLEWGAIAFSRVGHDWVTFTFTLLLNNKPDYSKLKATEWIMEKLSIQIQFLITLKPHYSFHYKLSELLVERLSSVFSLSTPIPKLFVILNHCRATWKSLA